jgi:hypothetical protein
MFHLCEFTDFFGARLEGQQLFRQDYHSNFDKVDLASAETIQMLYLES